MVLSLEELAAQLGLSMRSVVEIRRSDQRILAPEALPTPGAVARVRRWLDDGRPEVNLGALRFIGDDEVRRTVVDTVGSLPAPVRHYVVSQVTFLEVGRSYSGWMGRSPRLQAPEGDQPHLIVLSGAELPARMPAIVAHEVAHGWCEEADPEVVYISTEPDAIRTRRLIEKVPAEAIAQHRYSLEVTADSLAELWGYPDRQGHSLDKIRDRIRAAIARAAAIEGDRDEDDDP